MMTNTRAVPERPGISHIVARTRLWLVVAFLVPILVYLPVVFAEYGFSESYRLLSFYHGGPVLRHLVIAEGRPLYAVWAATMFGFLHGSIRALSIIRLVNLTIVGTVSVLIAVILERGGPGRLEAALGAIAIVMLPAFQLFAGTAAMGGAIVATALAAAAITTVPGRHPFRGDRGASPDRDGASAEDARVRPTSPDGHRKTPWAFATPVLCLVAAQWTYQPAALIYFALAGFLLLQPELEREEFRRRCARFAIVGGVSMVFAFAFFLLGRHLFPEELTGAPRGQLAFDPLAKLAWFFGLPLAHATNLWVLSPNVLLGVLLTIGLSAGMSFRVRSAEDRWLKILLAIGLVPLCYLPNLAVAESHSSFRSQPALATVVFCFYVIIAHRLVRSVRGAFPLLLAAAAAFACFTARNNVLRYIVRPQVRELELVRSTLAGLPPADRTIGIVKADFHDTLAPFVFYDEFGYPSTALPWSFTELTWLVLHEEAATTGRSAPLVVDVLGDSNRDAPIVSSTTRPDTIIDWGAVLRADRAIRPR